MTDTPAFLMRLVREAYPANAARECSVAWALVRRFGLRDAEAMVKGAQLLKYTSLIPLNAKAGVMRRSALSAYWAQQNSRKATKGFQLLGAILRKAMET